MTSTTSRALPFVSIGVLIVMILSPHYLGIELTEEQLNALVTILLPTSFAGAAKSAISKAAAARRALPEGVEAALIKRLEENVKKP